jgi:rhamnopyranosyl-N-acetylglucosaminyl-diphospho-decaprenol beta-1,3/1,4-galactofuranosyltransferase
VTDSTPSDPQLFGVLVTYRRPTELSDYLWLLARQDRPVDRLVVVDNSPMPENEASVAAYRSEGFVVDYLPMSANLGSAGGVAAGMERVLEFADDADWIAVFDDDDPPHSGTVLQGLMEFGETMVASDPQTAAVGLVGARFDWTRGRILRIPDDELEGAVAVDYIGMGHFPLYVTKTIRSVGPYSKEIFFGHSELEHGLRLRAAGFSLYVDGPQLLKRRADAGRLGLNGGPSRGLSETGWRRYYTLRNSIYILRSFGKTGTALRVTFARGLAKPIVNLPITPRLAIQHLALNARACWDGWTGRMGRRVEPDGTPRHA